jgi:hypothetical protein
LVARLYQAMRHWWLGFTGRGKEALVARLYQEAVDGGERWHRVVAAAGGRLQWIPLWEATRLGVLIR